MSVTSSTQRAIALACACLLAGCGGGGASGSGADPATAAAVQPAAAPATTAQAVSPASSAPAPQGAVVPAPPSGTRPDVATATLDEIAAWNAQCITARCMIVLPERSGRSLNWCTDPRVLEQANASCTPQPGCRIPDGDLLVWNFQCSPQPGCRVALSRPY